MKKCKRNKAFIGAIVDTVTQLISGPIMAHRQKKFMEEQQFNQNMIDGKNQAAALSSSINNQDYIDDYKDKITMKVGGKYKKRNNSDRITREKQFKCGGRCKKDLGGGSETDLSGTNKNYSSMNIASDIAGGAARATGNLAVLFQPKDKLINKELFGYNGKNSITSKDYQTDANGNLIQPQQQTNINNTIEPNPVTKPQNAFAVDRPSSARLGIKKYKKRK